MSTRNICWMDLHGWGDVNYYDDVEEARECRILRGSDHCPRHCDLFCLEGLDCE